MTALAKSFTATKGWVDPGNELFHRADGIIDRDNEVIYRADGEIQSDDAVIHRNNWGFRSNDAVIYGAYPGIVGRQQSMLERGWGRIRQGLT